MTCWHCGTDIPAGAARCAGCGALVASPTAHAGSSGDFDVTGAISPAALAATGGIPDAGAFETMGALPSAGTGTHQLGLDVTQMPAATPVVFNTSTSAAARPFTMLTPGQTLGLRYHIIRLLGVGGMGAVYHAWDAELGVAVALKVIRGDIIGDSDATAAIERQFKRELLLARQVTHKHVVRIHDLGTIDGIKYITMPYVQGADLASILKESGTLPVSRTLRYITQVVGGLVAAHEAGVVHRDLKPANIMIDEDDQALIMDFGIARSSSATGTGDKVVGTLAYMAPEQAQAKPIDQRADVYALGMMMREMLIGRKPGGDGQQAVADLMARIKAAPPRLRTIDATIPDAVDALAARCVEPDPADRFATSAELAAALAALDENGHLRPLSKPVRSPWRMTLAAVVVLVTVGTVAVVVRKTTPPTPAKAIDPVSILVADFDNRTGDAVFDGALEQSLSIAMEGASFITAYGRADALKLAKTLGNASKLDTAAARLVASREDVKYVLAGSVASSGGKYQLRLEAIDPQAGQTVRSAAATASTKSEVLGAVESLAGKIRTGLGDTTSAGPKAGQSETFTAGSIDAMREYSTAQDLQADGKADEALAHYQKAIAADAKFGRAYSGAANMMYRLGRTDEAEALWKQSLSLIDRMTEREKYRTLGTYYLAVAKNYDQAVENYAALAKNYPADRAGYSNLALSYFFLLDFQKALDYGRKAVQTYPKDASFHQNLALYAMYAGDFKTAAAEAATTLSLQPTVHKAYLAVAMAAVASGDTAAALRAYDEMSTLSPVGASLAAIGRADLALYEGRAADAQVGLPPSVAADLALKRNTPAAVKQVALAEALLAEGKGAPAIKAANDGLALSRQTGTQVLAARLLLHAGRTADARTIAADLEKSLNKQTRAYGKIVLAEIAIAANDTGRAIDLLDQAKALADVWLGRFDRGVAYVKAEHYAEAVAELDAAQKRRGEATALFFDDVPTVRYLATLPYWIGRAQEGLNITASAQAHYQEFLTIKKNTAPDPLVNDARGRVK